MGGGGWVRGGEGGAGRGGVGRAVKAELSSCSSGSGVSSSEVSW